MKSAIFILSFLLFSCTHLFSQQIIFNNPPEIVNLYETIELGIEIKGEAQNIIPVFPDIKGFAKIGSGSSENWINGAFSITYTVSYQALETGIFTIPGCRVNVDGKTYQNTPRKIKVIHAQNNQQKQSSGQQNFFDDFFSDTPQTLTYKSLNADIHLNLKFSKPVCYIGEQVLYEVMLYVNEKDAGKIKVSGESINDLQQRLKNPDFWDDQLEFSQIPMNIQKINGRTYRVYTLYKTVLFPLRAGKIPFQNIWLNVERLQVATGGFIIDQIRGNNTRFETIKIEAQPFTLTVLDAPKHNWQNTPPAGKFIISADPLPDTLYENEPLSLKISVQGNGNMASVPEPEINICKDSELIPAGKSSESHKTENGIIGESIWTYDLEFHQAGNCRIGPVVFRFLNPESGKYDSLVLPAHTLFIPAHPNLKAAQNPEEFYTLLFSELNASDSPNFMSILISGLILIFITFWIFAYISIKRKKALRDQNTV